MLSRPAGPDPPTPFDTPWTGVDVGIWIQAAFRAMPLTPIYAPRGNTLSTLGSDVPSATFDILAFSGTVLGDRSLERQAVLIWARAKVTKGEIGGSIAAFCQEHGWSRSTFEDRRRRACERIAEAKNRSLAQNRRETIA